jgi:hypothetical protein
MKLPYELVKRLARLFRFELMETVENVFYYIRYIYIYKTRVLFVISLVERSPSAYVALWPVSSCMDCNCPGWPSSLTEKSRASG